ncbi:unnamed protein product, partial [Thlaspi arvense]
KSLVVICFKILLMAPPRAPLSLFLLYMCCSVLPLARSGDSEALLTLKSLIDRSSILQWQGSDICRWQGVKECKNGRVTKLVLEHLNLTGELEEKSLNHLDQLRVLSFKGNSIDGQIPNLSGLVNLKSLFLNDNNFSGNFPTSLSLLHRLKVVVLSGNQISVQSPTLFSSSGDSMFCTCKTTALVVQSLPSTKQASDSSISQTTNYPVKSRSPQLLFGLMHRNIALCGEQIHKQCNASPGSAPSMSPGDSTVPWKKKPGNNKNRRKLVAIIAGSIGGFVLLLVCLIVLCLLVRRRKRSNSNTREVGSKVGGGEGVEEGEGSGGGGGGGAKQGGGFSWEGEGVGSLVFIGAGEEQMNYSLEDLLKASAETLGRGSMGSTYKAVMETGFIVTVKRLKDARYPRLEEFRRHMEVLGRLRHPNLVPLRAYFQAKEERLLVYDYFPNGSLFSLIHGTFSRLSISLSIPSLTLFRPFISV